MAQQTVTQRVPVPECHDRLWMGGLLAVFALLSLLYNVTQPLFEAPDEGDHFAYADLLARTARLPDLTADLTTSHEIIQPPLYYTLVAAVISPIHRGNLDAITHLNPDWFDTDVNADHRSVTNQYVHTTAEVFPYQGAVWAVHAARAFSTLLGALTIVLVNAIARLTIAATPPQSRLIPMLAAAVVAFNPKFIHVSSIVSNDIAITFSATLACWWMLRVWKLQRQRAGYFILGTLIGIAVLCKVTGLGLLAPAGVLILFAAARNHDTRRAALAWTARRGLAVAAGLLVAAGPWFIYNLIQYGHPLAWAQVQAANQSLLRLPPLTLAQIIQSIPQIVISYWGVIGIGLRYPAWIDMVFTATLALAVIGVAIRIARFARNAAADGSSHEWPVPVVILLAWEAVLLASYVVWLRDYTATENSRLIFPGISLIACAVAAGWAALRPGWLQRAFAGIACAGMLALSVLTPFVTVLPAFSTAAYLTDQQRATLPGQTGVTFGGKIQLQHAQTEDRAVQPGESLPVTLYWGALQPLKQSYRAILSARDAQGQLIGRLEAIPFNGRFDTQRWEPGKVFRDEYRLSIDRNAHRGIATVHVSVRGIYETPPLLPVDNANTDQFNIGQFKVLGAFQPVAAPQQPVSAVFANAGDRLIQLDGIDVAAADGRPMLAFHWRCLGQPKRDYTLFVHVIDRAGTIIAQQDAQPLNGAYPTGMWDAEEQIIDVRQLPLPANAASLRIGWYAPDTGARLSAQKPDGSQWQDNAVIIALPAASAP
jgi:4-amino-4-deoxy-L-arabinose transferase-like glycosyltransferase